MGETWKKKKEDSYNPNVKKKTRKTGKFVKGGRHKDCSIGGGRFKKIERGTLAVIDDSLKNMRTQGGGVPGALRGGKVINEIKRSLKKKTTQPRRVRYYSK